MGPDSSQRFRVRQGARSCAGSVRGRSGPPGAKPKGSRGHDVAEGVLAPPQNRVIARRGWVITFRGPSELNRKSDPISAILPP